MRCAPSLCFQTYNLDEQRSGELCSFVALLTKYWYYDLGYYCDSYIFGGNVYSIHELSGQETPRANE